jgi:acetyl/propionyl-CoA carboxylase alpha subunit
MIKVNVSIDGKPFEVDLLNLSGAEEAVSVTCNGEALVVAVPRVAAPDQMEWIIVNGRPYEIAIDPSLRWIKAFDGMHRVEVSDRSASVARPSSGDGRVKAPIPGLVTRVLVAKGDAVEAGQSLLLLEAMKMENEILAPRAGVVVDLNAVPGKSVTLHEMLVEIE